jgi:sugar lactone lactonase YvrE
LNYPPVDTQYNQVAFRAGKRALKNVCTTVTRHLGIEMKRLLALLAAPFFVIAAYFLAWPVPIDPVAVTPSENPGMTGSFAPNEKLKGVQHLIPGLGHGPEDVTRGPDGLFYTGFQDGRIVRFRRDGSGAETFVSTGGRPLGMQFDSQGNLIVADAFRGILSINPDGVISVLTDSVDGMKMLFVDDLDIAADGTIWFSGASQRFNQHNWILDFMELRASGRLLSYNPQTGQTSVHLDGLMFANGVALGPYDSYVLVNETMAARIIRFWLKGEKAGQHEVFLDALPAYPDNLSYNGRGIFWVALPSQRDDAIEDLWPRPFFRKVLMRLPASMRENPADGRLGWVIGVDEQGKIVHNLQDSSGEYGTITSVNEYGNELYLGSIVMTSVGRAYIK